MQAAYKLRHNLFVFPDPHNPGFVDEVEADLELIEQNSVGKRLIEKIAKCRHIIGIKYNSDGMHCNPLDIEGSFSPSKGSSSIVWFCLSSHPVKKISFNCESLESPRFVDFAHELIHAYHHSRGRAPKSNMCDQIVWSNDSEYKVIMGFPSKRQDRKMPKISENAFRIAQGLAPRFSHHGIEFLQNNPFIFSRIKLLAKVYNNQFSYQQNNEIKNLTTGDLQPLGGSVIFSRVFLLKGAAAVPIVDYCPPSEIEENSPPVVNIDDPEESPIAAHLKESYPNLLGIDTIGIYIINQEQADCLIKELE